MSTGSTFCRNLFLTIHEKLSSIDFKELVELSLLVSEVKMEGKKVIIAGNGGSAAIASHVSVDLTKAAGVRAINFNEADLLTCFSNDYGYERWLSQALSAYADAGDLFIGISSSGSSQNIINGVIQARQLGMATVTLSGFAIDNPLRTKGDLNLWCSSSTYNVVEVVHLSWLLCVVELLISGPPKLDE